MIDFPFDIDEFFETCVNNKSFPKNDFKKQAVLLVLIRSFEDRKYIEQEVNEIIKKHFEDYVLIRRELINFSYMDRDPYKGEYWVVKRELSLDDIKNNERLAKHAKDYIDL